MQSIKKAKSLPFSDYDVVALWGLGASPLLLLPQRNIDFFNRPVTVLLLEIGLFWLHLLIIFISKLLLTGLILNATEIRIIHQLLIDIFN